MYIHESLASALGMPFVVFVLLVAMVGVLLWAMKLLDTGTNKVEGGCTGDCYQGRYCNCGPTQEKDCICWPFPCEKAQLELPLELKH